MLKFASQGWTVLRGLVAFVKVVRDPAGTLDEVFEISARLSKPEQLAMIGNHVHERADHAATALNQRHRIDLKALLGSTEPLPQGSLGSEFREFVRSRGIDPADIPTMPVSSREDYVLAHLYETHDLWHVLCGFDTDTSGELGLQAFYIAQMPTTLSLVLIAAGLLNTAFFAIGERERRLSEILRGWQMGRRARILFGVDWSRYWAQPLEKVRREFFIQPSTLEQATAVL